MAKAPDEGVCRCVAIIPARGGSKGIPGKNLRRVGGVPLVARSILAAQASRRVQAAYVSTDDAAIALVAAEYGATVIQRPAAISGDTASSESALLHALETLKTQGIDPEILVFLQCTSPLTTPAAIDQVVEALENPSYAMAFSVCEDHGFLWGVDENGTGFGINHDASKARVRRQELPKQYRETGAIYALRTVPFREAGTRFCGPGKPVPLDIPAVEIDSPEDLHFMESLLAARLQTRKNILPPPGIKALVTDFDGVHTDDCVYVDENGKESVRCSRADGMGIEMLKKAGIEVLILSKEKNPVVRERAAKLEIPVIQNSAKKGERLIEWAADNAISLRNVAYIGNDIPDIECINMAGWSCCPADAHPFVRETVDFIAIKNGGYGALMEISEIIRRNVKKSI